MKKNIIYIIASIFITLSSCEDTYKDEYNKIQEELEQAKKEKEASEKEKANLEKENKRLNIKTQQERLDNILKWYVNYYILNELNHLRIKDFTTKNIIDKDEKLVQTKVYYSSFFSLISDNNYNYKSSQLTLDHTLTDEGLITKSTSPKFNMLWEWLDNNQVKIYISFKENNKKYELVSDENNKIISESLKDGNYYRDYSFRKFYYNDAGFIIKEEQFEDSEEVISFIDYSYDDNNNLVEYKVKNKHYDEPTIYELSYDSQNRLIRYYTKSASGIDENEITFIYDSGFTRKFHNLKTGYISIAKYEDESREVKTSFESKSDTYDYYAEYENKLIKKKIQNYKTRKYISTTDVVNVGDKLKSFTTKYESYNDEGEITNTKIYKYSNVTVRSNITYDQTFSFASYRLSEYDFELFEEVDGVMKLKEKVYHKSILNDDGQWETEKHIKYVYNFVEINV